jgi:hypothetical protein
MTKRDISWGITLIIAFAVGYLCTCWALKQGPAVDSKDEAPKHQSALAQGDNEQTN